jgi:flagellar hook assembly protein FlgD
VEEPQLYPNFPNPFAGSTTLRFYLAETRQVSIGIYDVTGRLVTMLVDSPLSAGVHEARWNGMGADKRPAAPGVYFLRMHTGGSSRTQKTILMR